MNIILDFFRITLDGWVYYVVVALSMFLIFVCMGIVCDNKRKKMHMSVPINTVNSTTIDIATDKDQSLNKETETVKTITPVAIPKAIDSIPKTTTEEAPVLPVIPTSSPTITPEDSSTKDTSSASQLVNGIPVILEAVKVNEESETITPNAEIKTESATEEKEVVPTILDLDSIKEQNKK